jgi:hypothetical protein
LVNYGGPWNGKGWYILWPFWIYCGHLVHFLAIWYIFWSFSNLVAIWYTVSRKIWQPRSVVS